MSATRANISIPETTRKRMENYPDIVWSKVATKAFEEAMDNYVEKGIEEIDAQIYKLTKEREKLVSQVKDK